MVLAYSRTALVSVLRFSPRIPLNTQLWRAITQFGISRVRPTRRGCRGRASKPSNLSIYGLSSTSSSLTSAGFRYHGIQDQDVCHLHTDSNDSLNIQVGTFTSGNTNNCMPESCSIMPVNCSRGYSTPRLSVPGETVLSTASSSSLTGLEIRVRPAGSAGAADTSIVSRKKAVACHSHQNHQNLIPLKRTQDQRSPSCTKSIIFGNVNA